MGNALAPLLFLSHGAPTLALDIDGEYARALRRYAGTLASPPALVVFSGHFEQPPPIRITAAAHPDLIYDFGGFPEEMYRIEYPAPGAPDLAENVRSLLAAAGFEATLDPRRGWDHGAWVPLRLAFPEAAIPVVEVSMPRNAAPEELMRIGNALASLRKRRVVLVGSGGIVHNLRRVRLERTDAIDGWAREFDAWVWQRLAARDFAALCDYRDRAPHADLAVPTTDHFDPLFVVLGAAQEADRLEPIFEGFQYGNISLRSFAFDGR